MRLHAFFIFHLEKWVWASARFEAFGREPGNRRLAKCDAGFVGTSSISFASAQSAKAHPFRCASSQNRNRVAGLRFCIFCTCRRNVGFCYAIAHAFAVEAENRTQRRHAPHGAVQALGAPAGSIVPIFFTGRKSALSARLREIHRFPLLRYVSAKIPFSLRAATLSRTNRVTFFGVIPRLPSGSIFADSADGEPRYSGSARSNSEKRCTS